MSGIPTFQQLIDDENKEKDELGSNMQIKAPSTSGGKRRRTRTKKRRVKKVKRKTHTRKYKRNEMDVGGNTMRIKTHMGKRYVMKVGDRQQPILSRRTNKIELYNYKKWINHKKLHFEKSINSIQNPQEGRGKKRRKYKRRLTKKRRGKKRRQRKTKSRKV